MNWRGFGLFLAKVSVVVLVIAVVAGIAACGFGAYYFHEELGKLKGSQEAAEARAIALVADAIAPEKTALKELIVRAQATQGAAQELTALKKTEFAMSILKDMGKIDEAEAKKMLSDAKDGSADRLVAAYIEVLETSFELMELERKEAAERLSALQRARQAEERREQQRAQICEKEIEDLKGVYVELTTPVKKELARLEKLRDENLAKAALAREKRKTEEAEIAEQLASDLQPAIKMELEKLETLLRQQKDEAAQIRLRHQGQATVTATPEKEETTG